jgi:hypothetical protein
MFRILALLMLTALSLRPGTAWAQVSERERLAAERQGLVDRFEAEERACRERFVVTACVDELRVRRRAALEPLRARELALDDAERQQRARDRQAARAARPQPASAAAARPAVEADNPSLRTPPAVTATVREPEPPRTSSGQTSRALQAAERARAAVKRAEMLDATQAGMARRNAERTATGKAGAALPVPAAASAAAR